MLSFGFPSITPSNLFLSCGWPFLRLGKFNPRPYSVIDDFADFIMTVVLRSSSALSSSQSSPVSLNRAALRQPIFALQLIRRLSLTLCEGSRPWQCLKSCSTSSRTKNNNSLSRTFFGKRLRHGRGITRLLSEGLLGWQYLPIVVLSTYLWREVFFSLLYGSRPSCHRALFSWTRVHT